MRNLNLNGQRLYQIGRELLYKNEKEYYNNIIINYWWVINLPYD